MMPNVQSSPTAAGTGRWQRIQRPLNRALELETSIGGSCAAILFGMVAHGTNNMPHSLQKTVIAPYISVTAHRYGCRRKSPTIKIIGVHTSHTTGNSTAHHKIPIKN